MLSVLLITTNVESYVEYLKKTWKTKDIYFDSPVCSLYRIHFDSTKKYFASSITTIQLIQIYNYFYNPCLN